jgi:hypothetical protein
MVYSATSPTTMMRFSNGGSSEIGGAMSCQAHI